MAGSQHRHRKSEEAVAFLSSGNESGYGGDAETKFIKSISHRRRHPGSFWMISTFILTGYLIISHLFGTPTKFVERGECNISQSDFPPLRAAIEYEQRRYIGEVWFNSTSRVAERLPHPKGEAVYFGRPSRQLENTWKNMLHDMFPILYDDEVIEATIDADGLKDSDRFPDGHFHFVPDVYHNLHCVNMIRKFVSKSLYVDEQVEDPELHHEEEEKHRLEAEAFGPNYHQVHLEHCMDRIRQALICHADLTPSIQYRFDGLYGALGRTGSRTCRKLGPIRKWLDERAEKDQKTIAEEKTFAKQQE